MKGFIKKNFLPLVVAGAIALGSGGTVIFHKIASTPSDTRVENEVGTDDFIPGFIASDQFSILDAGNHKDFGTLFLYQKFDYCRDNGISCGIKVHIDTDSLGSVYEDVDYVKGLVRDNNITYPVYLDVDKLLNDNNLDVDTLSKFASTFLEKCNDNGIYVGLYGTDTNLCLFKEYTGITSYDAYLVQDSEEIKYDGVYNVKKDLDGNITSAVNLETVISQNGNNTRESFHSDLAYTCKENETLRDVAFKYGVSVNDLLAFNDIDGDHLSEGTIIRIPSEIGKKASGDYSTLDSPLRGADLSYAQGMNIDWEKMADNFSFLIFKCNEGLMPDECFENNITNANNYNIPVGVYTYNAYDKENTSSLEDFINKEREQVQLTLRSILGKNVSYPVYLDVEMSAGEDFYEHFDSEYVSHMLNIWMEEVSNAGYTPGLYCNQSGLEALQSMVNYPLEDRFELWVAGGEQYMAGKEDVPFEDVVPSSILEDNPAISMAQSTDSAVGAGAGNGKGHLDINFSEVDYTVATDDSSIFPIKEYNHLPIREVGLGTLGAGLLIGGSIIGVKHRSNVKAKKR